MTKYRVLIEVEVEADDLQSATSALWTILNPQGCHRGVKLPLRIVRAEEVGEPAKVTT